MFLLESKINHQQKQTAKMISHAAANVQKKIEGGMNPKEKKEIERLEKSLDEAKAILKMNDKQVLQYSVLVQRKLIKIVEGLVNLVYGIDMLSKALIIAVNAICMGVSSILYMLFKKLTIEADKKILQNNTKKIIKKLEKLEKELPDKDRGSIRKEIEKLNKLI